MRKLLKLTLSCLAFSQLPSYASAQANVVINSKPDSQLIELYTSQGCSSCPPADKWLSRLKNDDKLWDSWVPVAFHVDYWDWIGWQDPYAQKSFSERQRNYKKRGAITSVYTPGFVVDGAEWRGWFDRKALPKPTQKSGNLKVSRQDQTLNIQFDNPNNKTNLTLHVALEGFNLATPVAKGENADKKLIEDFVVLWYQTLAQATGKSSWDLTLPNGYDYSHQRFALAIWLTHEDSPKPIAVVGFWLKL